MADERQPSFPLRLPEDVRRELEQEADRMCRSLNGEILFRLKQSLKGRKEEEVMA